MTDLNKERELELFNAFVEKNLPELFEKHSNGNFFAKVTYDSMFGAWLGAKAQAVPEGYALVPKEPTEKMANAFDIGMLESEHFFGEFDAFQDAYTAMIKAAGDQNEKN
ncbi:hypothetical protein [Acinetobacter baumannii]|uniref:hypothetical protein n=1 Tax=Acinetobacter baumannii TaxID=470 RepID=UPI003AF5536D